MVLELKSSIFVGFKDLFVYEMVSKYFPFDCDELPKKFPNLYKVKERVGKSKEIVEFMKENKFQTPQLSKNAVNDLSQKE
jgi:hypothetical protein